MGFGGWHDDREQGDGEWVLAEEVEVVRVAQWGDGYGEFFVRCRGERHCSGLDGGRDGWDEVEGAEVEL